MDFLDPRKKRAHKIRLMIGYGLVSIAIGLGTVVLVYTAYGYGFNPRTRDIVENGLVFTGSIPGDVEIYLNDRPKNKTTPARLIMPAGQYKLTYKKDGYRDWQRDFILQEHSVKRFMYPFLFPVELRQSAIKKYGAKPLLLSQSPNQHRLLIVLPAPSSATVSIEEFDTRRPKEPPRPISLPRSLFGGSGQLGQLSEVEWSAESNFLLLKHRIAGKNEFVLLDVRNPQRSLNLNTLFSVSPSEMALRDKKPQQVFIFDKTARTLRVGDIGARALRPVFLTDVLAFTAHEQNLLSYVTPSATKGQVSAMIWQNGQSFMLDSLPQGQTYLLDAEQFRGRWYYITGSSKSERLKIFKDPIDGISSSESGRATPVMTLAIAGANKVEFSPAGRFVAAQAGQKMAVYDFEEQQKYEYTQSLKLAGPVSWMDGYRLIGQSGGKVVVYDFDSVNRQLLTPTLLPSGGYFSQDYELMFTLAAVSGSKDVILQSVNMRAGSDLPD